MNKLFLLMFLLVPSLSDACLIKLTSFHPSTDIDKSVVYFEKSEITSIGQVRFGYLYTKVCNKFGVCINVYESPDKVKNMSCDN